MEEIDCCQAAHPEHALAILLHNLMQPAAMRTAHAGAKYQPVQLATIKLPI
jgi:hypothetical protein